MHAGASQSPLLRALPNCLAHPSHVPRSPARTPRDMRVHPMYAISPRARMSPVGVVGHTARTELNTQDSAPGCCGAWRSGVQAAKARFAARAPNTRGRHAARRRVPVGKPQAASHIHEDRSTEDGVWRWVIYSEARRSRHPSRPRRFCLRCGDLSPITLHGAIDRPERGRSYSPVRLASPLQPHTAARSPPGADATYPRRPRQKLLPSRYRFSPPHVCSPPPHKSQHNARALSRPIHFHLPISRVIS